MLAFVFPGQGSQKIGMGKELYENFPEARAVFKEVDDALSQNLSKLMFEGAESDLTLTSNAQPALMAVSIAVARTLEKELGQPLSSIGKCVAGHSLGEYSALCAAGALTLADTAKLLRIRGDAMQSAVPVGKGAMAAVIGLSIEQIETVCASIEGGICDVANDNSPGQVVISGEKAAVEAAGEKLKELGAKRVVMLPVSAPFHCSLMQPAADAMAEALSSVPMQTPSFEFFANVSASMIQDPKEIKDLLVKQVTGRVRWRESVEAMAAHGVGTLIELGSGKVLTGLARRINRDLEAVSIETAEDMDTFLKKTAA